MWLLVAISSYLIFAVVFLVDKYLLTGPIPSPKVYCFYVGIFGILLLIIAPFVGFYIPELGQIALALFAGVIFILALFWFYKALRVFEASRVIPAIGGLTPLFSIGLIYLFSRGTEILSFSEIIAFVLLVAGSILITYEKKKAVNLKSLRISAVAAFFFALMFVLSKYVYLAQPFWPGFIWIKIGSFLAAIFLLVFSKEIKQEIFRKKITFQKKTLKIFFANQVAGGGAGILQNWAIALAPLACVAIINALQGIQYVFLLIFTVLLSWKFPKILKEEISKEIIFQKIIAILLIGAGLVLLVL